jgi:hypothetical protein
MSENWRSEAIWLSLYVSAIDRGDGPSAASGYADAKLVSALSTYETRWPHKPEAPAPEVRSSDLGAIKRVVDDLRESGRFDAQLVLASLLEAFTNGTVRSWVPPPRGGR